MPFMIIVKIMLYCGDALKTEMWDDYSLIGETENRFRFHLFLEVLSVMLMEKF